MNSSATKAFALGRGLFYATVFFLLWRWVVLSVMPLDIQYGWFLPSGLKFIGAGIAVLGGLVVLWCVLSFAVVGDGTPAPFDAPRKFVATGPYRYVRNPMYLGAAGVIAGAGLFLQSLSATLVFIPFLLAFHLFVLVYEEPKLRRLFSDSYLAYTGSVNRWIPALPDASDLIR